MYSSNHKRFNSSFIFLISAFLFPVFAEDLITIEKGDVPIILSAPHGGSETIPGSSPRKNKHVYRFVTASDKNTDKITEEIADEIEKHLGKRPYVVIARFHRKYMDANRSPENAYESDSAKEVYDAYHDALIGARKDVTARWGSGFVFDIHGQAKRPGHIVRGTRNGTAVRHLVETFGQEAVMGHTSLFGQLAKQGFPVLPEVGSTDKESIYTGGHITIAHGSADGGTVDAIQIEIGRAFRSTADIENTAEKIATAISEFAKVYLPQQELSEK